MEGRGLICYGLHFYPGVAQYEDGSRVFLNEDTLRKMDPTFAGCPVFIQHVDEVQPNVDEVRKEADGWVIESFFNQADGKHWVKFVVCTKAAQEAVKTLKLSNCYLANDFAPGGEWNGVPYARQVMNAKYEHLALVANPRYEESVIMSPDEFKAYNESCLENLKRLSNEKEGKMKLSFWNRKKVDDGIDIASMSVTLPESKKEISIAELVKNADEAEKKKDEPVMANGDHHVEFEGKKMTVNELKAAYMDACKKNAEDDSDSDEEEQNEEQKEEPKEEIKEKVAEKVEEKKEEPKEEPKEEKKPNSKDAADRLRNAHRKAMGDVDAPPMSMHAQVELGKKMFGSQK